MENSRRWTDSLTSKPPKNEQLTEDGRRAALKVLAGRTPLDEISFGREEETDEDRQFVIDTARQEAARLFGLGIVENPQAEVEAGSPQPVTVKEDSKSERELTPEQIEAVTLLKGRFDDPKNKNLCPTLSWEKAEKTLRATPKALETVLKAEQAGHEPTIYFADEEGFDIGTGAKETPQSTRNCVYDVAAEEFKKKRNPGVKFNGNAVGQARAMGWSLMRASQEDHIARKTESYYANGRSWYDTNENIRSTGYAFIGLRDRDVVIVNQRDARSYFADSGWRGSLRVNFVS